MLDLTHIQHYNLSWSHFKANTFSSSQVTARYISAGAACELIRAQSTIVIFPFAARLVLARPLFHLGWCSARFSWKAAFFKKPDLDPRLIHNASCWALATIWPVYQNFKNMPVSTCIETSSSTFAPTSSFHVLITLWAVTTNSDAAFQSVIT